MLQRGKLKTTDERLTMASITSNMSGIQVLLVIQIAG